MKNERQFLLSVLRDDEEAVAFIEALFHIAQVWDDLVDADQNVSVLEINAAFIDALITLPRNRFWQRHAAELQPLIEAAVIDWKTANHFERAFEHDQTLAFVLREHIAQVVIRAAWCLGGMQWAEHVAPSVWRENHDGTLEQYLREKRR